MCMLQRYNRDVQLAHLEEPTRPIKLPSKLFLCDLTFEVQQWKVKKVRMSRNVFDINTYFTCHDIWTIMQ